MIVINLLLLYPVFFLFFLCVWVNALPCLGRCERTFPKGWVFVVPFDGLIVLSIHCYGAFVSFETKSF